MHLICLKFGLVFPLHTIKPTECDEKVNGSLANVCRNRSMELNE